MDASTRIIAALSTPPGRGALAVIRLTGDGAHEAFAEIIAEKEKFEKEAPRRIGIYTVIDTARADTGVSDKISGDDHTETIIKKHNQSTVTRTDAADTAIVNADNNRFHGADVVSAAIDEVTAVKYNAPSSYTGEDMVEIFCHGGAIIPAKILNRLFRQGARAAGRGEFSRRALINGKISVLKAESIRELIESQTETHLRSARLAYFGKQSETIERLKQEIIAALSDIESRIEFDEDDDVAESKQRRISANKKTLALIAERLEDELRRGDRVKALDDGIIVTIAGPANAGKSSLFNEILGYDRSIVHDRPGTTRDIVSERLNFDGATVKLFDSAGIRETEDAVERLGMDRTRSAVAEAHAVLWVTSAVEAFGEDERERILGVAAGIGEEGKRNALGDSHRAQEVDIYDGYGDIQGEGYREKNRLVVIINKIDEDDSLSADFVDKDGCNTLAVMDLDTNEPSIINDIDTDNRGGTMPSLPVKSYIVEKRRFCEEHGLKYVEASITRKLNRERLFDTIGATIKGVTEDIPAPAIIINERHRGIVEAVVGDVRDCLDNFDREEVAAHCLRTALDRLAEFSGHIASDEVLNGIFERFCIGK